MFPPWNLRYFKNTIFTEYLCWLLLHIAASIREWIYYYLHLKYLPHVKFKVLISFTTWKVSKYGVIFGTYFPVFGVNTEIYSVNRKIRTRNNSVFGHISCSFSYSRFDFPPVKNSWYNWYSSWHTCTIKEQPERN